MLLLISAWHPEPVDNGAKQRVRMFIQALEAGYSLVLISLLPADEVDPRNLPRVPSVRYQYALPLPEYQSSSARSLLSGATRMPRSLRATWDPQTAHSIGIIAAWHRARLAIGFDLRVTLYLAALAPRLRTILDEPNVSPFIPPPARLSAAAIRGRVRAWKYQKLIQDVSPRISSVVAPSESEREAYRVLGGTSPSHVIENSVPQIPAEPWSPPDGKQLLYTGSITYRANADAVEFFAGSVLPGVRVDGAELVVTGALPHGVEPGEFLPGVHLTGRLDDLDAHFRKARLFVAPLREGTGTRIKLLEAMAHGMPIVSTTKGAEGLPVEHGEHLLLADGPDAFASACQRLLNAPELSLQLGAQARELVQRRFTWDAQLPRIRSIVGQVLGELEEQVARRDVQSAAD